MTRLGRIGAALLLAAGLLFGPALPAAAFETTARQAILVDHGTGTVLFAKSPDEPMPPASMSKLMTIYMLFEALKEGRLKLEDELPVSERAWRKGGSKMFVEVGKTARVEDLLRGIVVQSGNDACVVIAEALAGTEEAFAQRMTERARELGLRNSRFANASGWPDPNQHMTARDLAVLAGRLVDDFPFYYGYFKETEFTYGGIRQGNRNPLLYKATGADGLKTGHTEESGYGLVASAVQGDRRLVLVVNGLESVNHRSNESERMLGWGFREFETRAFFQPGETVEQARVWLGEAPTVPLIAAAPVMATVPRSARKEMVVSVVYDGPVPAPVAQGAQIATLRISGPDMEPKEVPLLAGAEVERLGAMGRIFARLGYLVWNLAGQ